MNKEKKKMTKKEMIFLVISVSIMVAVFDLLVKKITENFWLQLAVLSGIMVVVGLIIRLVIHWNRSRQSQKANL